MEKEELEKRLKSYAAFVDNTVKLFEDLAEVSVESIRKLEGKIDPSSKEIIMKNYIGYAGRLGICYLHQERFYETFPELRPEKNEVEK